MTPMFCLLRLRTILRSAPRPVNGSEVEGRSQAPMTSPAQTRHLLPAPPPPPPPPPSSRRAPAWTQPFLWKFQQFKLISNRLHNYARSDQCPAGHSNVSMLSQFGCEWKSSETRKAKKPSKTVELSCLNFIQLLQAFLNGVIIWC